MVILSLINGVLGVFSVLIFVRIIFSWIGGVNFGRVGGALARICDPYLNWFRRFSFLRIGFLDLSPIAGIAVIAVAQNALGSILRFGRVSIGFLLAIVFQFALSAANFILGFAAVILVLRFIAYCTRRNIAAPFWQVIETISHSILYRVGRVLYPRRIVTWKTGITTSIAVIIAAMAVLGIAGHFVTKLLMALPI